MSTLQKLINKQLLCTVLAIVSSNSILCHLVCLSHTTPYDIPGAVSVVTFPALSRWKWIQSPMCPECSTKHGTGNPLTVTWKESFSLHSSKPMSPPSRVSRAGCPNSIANVMFTMSCGYIIIICDQL